MAAVCRRLKRKYRRLILYTDMETHREINSTGVGSYDFVTGDVGLSLRDIFDFITLKTFIVNYAGTSDF